MADLLDAAAALASPWDEVRRLHPGAILVRLIYRDKDLQGFLRLNPKRDLAQAASVYDGATVISPAPASDEEREAILARADAAWRA